MKKAISILGFICALVAIFFSATTFYNFAITPI